MCAFVCECHQLFHCHIFKLSLRKETLEKKKQIQRSKFLWNNKNYLKCKLVKVLFTEEDYGPQQGKKQTNKKIQEGGFFRFVLKRHSFVNTVNIRYVKLSKKDRSVILV